MNRLAQESSPYLLQHAHNPVDWYPWGDEALARARAEDKPILVSIGYAACHWCHVMERESFEDAETAHLMNELFINIKIDREERPDLDHIYMEAVQAIAGNGGWPLNVFLTPQGKPFYGGTYFPPRPIHGRSSWKEVLAAIASAFRDKRTEIEQQSQGLTDHIARTGLFGSDQPSGITDPFTAGNIRQIYQRLMDLGDKEEGGFGQAPKFPQTFSIQFLLHYYQRTKDEAALRQACLSLDKMIRGGIYDQLGGGFARYSTDNEWLAPHFEKMLYDNALLVIVLSEAWQLTHKELYRQTIEETMTFIQREFLNGEGAFYSALDADSEGIEGKYYVWDKKEIDELLGDDAALFASVYPLSERGNWEGTNILTRRHPGPVLTSDEEARLQRSRHLLMERRSRRVRPALDDKVLLGWNALMNIACSKAYGALGEEKYRDWAIANMRFCQEKLKGSDLYYFHHSYKAGRAKIPAFLDDYATLTAALIQLQEITGNTEYLVEANSLVKFVLDNFSEAGTDFFYYTHQAQEDVIVRKKELYDGATPSGNALMAINLSYIAIIFNEPEWGLRGRAMAAALEKAVLQYPASFGIWATLFQAITYTIPEIVLTGSRPEIARKEFLKELVPYRVFQSSDQENTHFPLLRGKSVKEIDQFFLCKDYSCQPPVNDVITLTRFLENVQKFEG